MSMEYSGLPVWPVTAIFCCSQGTPQKDRHLSPSHIIYGRHELWEEPGFLVCPLDFRGFVPHQPKGKSGSEQVLGTVPNVLAHAQLKVNDYCDHSMF